MSLIDCILSFQSASGTGLAFIIFTEAINQFPGAQFWAVLFFLMLFTLGVDSQFGTLEGVSTSLMDMKLFPKATKEQITGVGSNCSFPEFTTYFNTIGFTNRFVTGPVLELQHHIDDLCKRGRELYIPVDGQLCRELYTPYNRVL